MMADKPKYFWDVWLEKRRAKQARRAESAIPRAALHSRSLILLPPKTIALRLR